MAKRSKKKGRSKRGGGEEKNAASGAGGSGGGDPTLPATGSAEAGGNSGGATTADFARGEGMRSLGGAGENTDADQFVASDCDSGGSGGGAVPCGASSVVVESAIPLPGFVAGSEAVAVAVAVAQDRDGSPPAAALAGGSEAATSAAGVSQQDLDSSMVDEMDAWIADDNDSSVLRAEGSGPLGPPEGKEEDGAVAHEGGGRMAPEARDGPDAADLTPPSSPTASAAALADGSEDRVRETPNPTTAVVLPEEAKVVGVAASSGAGVETPPRVEALPAMETAREMAAEARVRQDEDSVERPGTACSVTEAPPPFDTGPEHDPSATEEVRLGAAADGVPTDGGSAGAVTLTTTQVLEAGLGGNAEEDAALAAVGKPVSEGSTPVVERVDEAATETLAATPTSAAAAPPAATAALAATATLAASAAASASAESPMPPASPSRSFGVAATDDSAALRAAEPGSLEGSSEPPPPPAFASVRNEEATLTLPASPTTSADINNDNTAACPEQGVEVLARESALAAVAEGAASQTPPSPPPPPPLNSATGGGGPGRERATAAKAAAASARAAALLASAQAASAAEVAAAAVAEAEAALGAVAGPEAKGGVETTAAESAAPRSETARADEDLVMTKATQVGADKVGVRAVSGGDAVSTVGPAPGSVEPPAMPDSVVTAAPVKVVDEPSGIGVGVVLPIAGAATAAAATAAASESSSHDVAAQALGEGGEGEASATRAAVDGADADPPVAAPLPPVFSDGSGGSESDAEAAAVAAAVEPTVATILSGSVTAEVFASRSGAGAIPWPGSSEDDESNDGDEYDGSDKGGRRSSSRNHMSVEEAAAFMNPGGAGTGRMGSGRFASGSSWGGASAIGHLDRILGLPTAVPAESSPGATAAADGSGGGGGGDDGGDGAPGEGFSSSSGWLLLGGGPPPLGEPFVGPDDFLSPSSVGMSGLAARRFSSSAAVMQGFASSGGVAEDAGGGLGVRRSTVNEIASSRGAELCGDEAKASQAAGVGMKEVVIAEDDGASDDDDSIGAGEGGGVRPTERAAEEKPAPAATEVQEETPTLLLRRGEEGRVGKAAAVQAVSTVVAGQGGTSNRSGGSGLRNSGGEAVIAGEGGGGVKNSDGNDGLDASESAATSFAGAEGEAGWPPGGVEGRAAVSGTRTAAGGGCCVVS